jgi:hypothetical protein
MRTTMNPDGGIKRPGSNDRSLVLGKLAKSGKAEKSHDSSGTMTADEQVMELVRTVKCRLGPSRIHGVGVVTLRDIKKAEQLYCANRVKPTLYTVPFTELKQKLQDTHAEILALILERWPRIVNGEAFISPNYDARLTSFMNHSDTPNYDPVTDLALADIAKGEEVFEDYRKIANYEKAFPWLAVVS